MKKEYFRLFLKDTPLCIFSRKFGFNESGNVRNFIEIEKIETQNKFLFPFAIRENITSASLESWLYSRITPMGKNLLKAAGGDPNDPLYKIEITRLLSLNDSFWVDYSETSSTWEKINLYQNDFSPEIGSIIFNNDFNKQIRMLERSPEYASSKGNLRKCWIIRDKKRILIKADDMLDSGDGRSQVTAEWLASQVANFLELPHITYSLENFIHSNGKKELVCSCPIFTSEDYGYVEAFNLTKIDPRRLRGQDALAKILGKNDYANMMIFDSIIGNQDRHLGNFCALFDTSTGKIVKMAPIFDNGLSLLVGCSKEELKDFSIWDKKRSGAILDFDVMIKEFAHERHYNMLKRLLDFNFSNPPDVIPEKIIDTVTKFIKHRAKYIMQKIESSPTSYENNSPTLTM